MSDERDIPEEPTGDPFVSGDLFPEQEAPEVRVKQPVTARGVAIVGARAVAGLVGIGVAVVTIGASALLPLPTVTATPGGQVVTPVPTAQQLVCPGSILRLSDESGAGATVVSAIGRATVRSGASSGDVDTAPFESSDASTGGTPEAPSTISTPPNAADPTERVLLSGAQSQQADEGDFVGLAAATCEAASGDMWLAGGSTTVGRTTLLVLANPSEVPATVNLQLFGENGPITAPGTNGIIVPASGQRVLSLAGFQPDLVSPVVHVTSTGGQVSASLQQSIVRGLAPGGVDIVASAEPSTDTVIPGVHVTDLAAVQALRGGGESFGDVESVLRLFTPGENPVSLTVNVIPEDGAQTGTSFAMDLDAGHVTDVLLEELATGNYTVRIDSESPVVAAVRTTSAVGSATDLAWSTPAAQLVDRAQFTVASGPSPVLHLANPSAADAAVVLARLGGESTTVTVPAGGSTLLAVEPGASYDISGFETLHATITMTDGGMIAGYTLRPPGVGSAPVTVYP